MKHKLVLLQKANEKSSVSKDTAINVDKESPKQEGEPENNLSLYENCAMDILVDGKAPKDYAACLMEM